MKQTFEKKVVALMYPLPACGTFEAGFNAGCHRAAMVAGEADAALSAARQRMATLERRIAALEHAYDPGKLS